MILCCGEALIDMLPEGACFRPVPGGGVFNTALALGRLGVRTAFLWPLSHDRFGQMLRAPLVAAGVDLSLSPACEAPTTLAFVSVEAGEARYAFYDAGTTGQALRADDLPAILPDISALFLGGISLVHDGPAAAIDALMERARAPVVMLDPNIRPALISDMVAHRRRIEALARRAAIIRLSGEDAQALWPDQAPDRVAKRLLAGGARLVIITHGAAGAVAYRHRGHLHCPAPQGLVSDTIGAGDGFNAGLLAGLAARDLLDPAALAAASDADMAGALAHATRVAGLMLGRPGADPPWASEV